MKMLKIIKVGSIRRLKILEKSKNKNFKNISTHF